MIPARARIASQLLDLRVPLTRISLATSQLDRSAASPAAERECERMREAVRSLDEGIERLLQSLAMDPATEERADAADVLAALADAGRSLLAARGATLELGEASGTLPRSRARRAGIALLRAAMASLRRGDRVELAAASDELRIRTLGDEARPLTLATAIRRDLTSLGVELVLDDDPPGAGCRARLEAAWDGR